MELERAGQHTRDVVLGEHVVWDLATPRESLVPTAEHRERVRHLAEREPLEPPVADPSRKSDRLVQVIERLRVPVALEAEVGKVAVELTRCGMDFVLERRLEAELEETTCLLGTARPGETRLDVPAAYERFRDLQGLGNVEPPLDPFERLLVVPNDGVN